MITMSGVVLAQNRVSSNVSRAEVPARLDSFGAFVMTTCVVNKAHIGILSIKEGHGD